MLNSILTQAKDSLIVKNKALTLEQATYCMAWHECIGDQNNVIYAGIGPDLATVLLTTNATKITGIDPSIPDYKRFNSYIDNWSNFTTIIEKIHSSNSQSIDWTRRFMKDMIQRKNQGYWDVHVLDSWGIELCIMHELRSLAVDPKTIFSEQTSNGMKLYFNWHGQRVVEYVKERAQHTDLSIIASADCYYQKSIPEATIQYISKTLALTAQHMKKTITLLIGLPMHTYDYHLLKTFSNNGFVRIGIDCTYERMMHRTFGETPHQEYGWKLYGFKRQA